MFKKRKKSMEQRHKERKEYVNKEYSKRVSGTSMSNKQKTKLFKKLWKLAKRKIK